MSSAAVSAVTSYPQQRAPPAYGFVVAFPAVEVAALTAAIRQAYDSGDALGMSVAGKLWQAPQTRRGVIALRAEQVNLLAGNKPCSFTACWSRLADRGCLPHRARGGTDACLRLRSGPVTRGSGNDQPVASRMSCGSSSKGAHSGAHKYGPPQGAATRL